MKSDLEEGGAGRRILVHRIGHLGDTLITLPAFWAVREHFPQAHIALLSNAFEGSNRVLAQSVLPAAGLFDQWLTYPTGDDRTPVRGFFKLLRRLRRERFAPLVILRRASARAPGVGVTSCSSAPPVFVLHRA